MSDEELEEYYQKIKPNFISHIEKGTIEMNNEFFNVLEERIVRVVNKNNNLQDQLQQKENIIKEVREYINNNTYKTEWGDFEEDNEDININDDLSEKNFIESILEILDKENK